MKQLNVIEIRSEIFNALIDDGHLSVNDVIVLERYQQGDPELTALRKLRIQAQKDRNAVYAAASKEIDKMIEAENNMKKL